MRRNLMRRLTFDGIRHGCVSSRNGRGAGGCVLESRKTALENGDELSLGKCLRHLGARVLLLGKGGQATLPPQLLVLVGAKVAALLFGLTVIETGWLLAPGQAAGLLEDRDDALVPVGAVRAHEALDEVLANVLVDADTLSVEPVFADVAAYHESVVVRSPADAIRAVVRLIAFIRVCSVAIGLGLGAAINACVGRGRLLRDFLGLLGAASGASFAALRRLLDGGGLALFLARDGRFLCGLHDLGRFWRCGSRRDGDELAADV
jgi:hypothetical protein